MYDNLPAQPPARCARCGGHLAGYGNVHLDMGECIRHLRARFDRQEVRISDGVGGLIAELARIRYEPRPAGKRYRDDDAPPSIGELSEITRPKNRNSR